MISVRTEIEDFEFPISGWDIITDGHVPYGISSDHVRNGHKAFAAGPSECPIHSYGNYSVTLRKQYLSTQKGVRVSFWLKNSFHIGGYLQVFAYHPIHGATLLGTCLPDPTWQFYEFVHYGSVDQLRFYFVDITERNALYLDSVSIQTGECIGRSSVPVDNVQVSLLLGLMLGIVILSGKFLYKKTKT
jgi:hypothetical protein